MAVLLCFLLVGVALCRAQLSQAQINDILNRHNQVADASSRSTCFHECAINAFMHVQCHQCKDSFAKIAQKVLLIVQYRCGVSPYTSNMPRLVWNANLAAVAQQFVLA